MKALKLRDWLHQTVGQTDKRTDRQSNVNSPVMLFTEHIYFIGNISQLKILCNSLNKRKQQKESVTTSILSYIINSHLNSYQTIAVPTVRTQVS